MLIARINVAPLKQVLLRSQSYTVGIPSCLQHGNLHPYTHQQILLIDLIDFMLLPLLGIRKLKLRAQSKNEV